MSWWRGRKEGLCHLWSVPETTNRPEKTETKRRTSKSLVLQGFFLCAKLSSLILSGNYSESIG